MHTHVSSWELTPFYFRHFMDSMLIEVGLQHFADLLKMTPQEREEFHHAYYQRYDPTNYLLIWCELRTTWSELYLDSNRWLIFIEDHAMNQYEPVRILQESQSSQETVTDSLPRFRSERRRPRWEIHQKT